MATGFSNLVRNLPITADTPGNWIEQINSLPNGHDAFEKPTANSDLTFGVVGTSLSIVGVWNTIEFWIKPKAGWDTARVLLKAADVAGGNLQWYIDTNGAPGGVPNIAFRNASRGVAIGAALNLDQWNYAAAMFLCSYYGSASATGYTAGYVNGLPLASGSSGGSGRLSGAGSGCGIHFMPSVTSVCEIAKVAHYTRQVAWDEVQAKYTAMMAA